MQRIIFSKLNVSVLTISPLQLAMMLSLQWFLLLIQTYPLA
jgi:hypothetical protein